MTALTLALWLSAAPVLPTCCWSMVAPAEAQSSPASGSALPAAHHQQHRAVQADPHSHHPAHEAAYPGSSEDVGPSAAQELATDAPGCGAASAAGVAAAYPGSARNGSHAGDAARMPGRAPIDLGVNTLIGTAPTPPDVSTPHFGFLSPLRI